MSRSCRNQDCTFAQGGRCAREAELPGPPEQYCPELEAPQNPDPAQADTQHTEPARPTPVVSPLKPPPASAPAVSTPWSGRHLGPQEVQYLLDRSPARVFAVLGPYDAGKTCLLASFFLQLANGQREGFPYRVASSRTLHALHTLAQRAATWTGHPHSEIVAHTPKGETIAYLHLGVCPEDGQDVRHLELLYSDLPGEWATEWSQTVDDETSRRMAFLGRCDGFMLVVDASTLIKSPRNDAETSRLLRRLLDVHAQSPRRRSLALVLSKFDQILDQVEPPSPEQYLNRDAWGVLGKRLPRTWSALKDAQARGLPVAVFPASAFPAPLVEGQPIGVVEPFAFLLNQADPRTCWGPAPRPSAPPPKDRPFLAMQYREEQP